MLLFCSVVALGIAVEILFETLVNY